MSTGLVQHAGCSENTRTSVYKLSTARHLGDAHPYNIFHFTLDRGRDGPKYFLKDYRQVLLADAYGGYNGVVVGNEITRAGCWSHTRRKIIEAEKAAPEIAQQAIELDLRQRQSAPVLAQLRQKLLSWKEQLLPKHPMAEAVNYALRQWTALCPSTTTSVSGK